MAEQDPGKPEPKGLNRRKFLHNTGGAAAGLAVVAVPPAVALAAPAAASAHPVDPSGEMPHEPVMAYVHNAERGEVTVLAGTTERTYRDPILAKRLLDAARDQTA